MRYNQPLNVSNINKETKIFTQIIIELCKEYKLKTLLDVGCGTGYIAIESTKQGLKCKATDTNKSAIETTKQNATKHKVYIETQQTNLLTEIHEQYDIITFNAPLTDKITKSKYTTIKGAIRRTPIIHDIASTILQKDLYQHTHIQQQLLKQAPKKLNRPGFTALLAYDKELAYLYTNTTHRLIKPENLPKNRIILINKWR